MPSYYTEHVFNRSKWVFSLADDSNDTHSGWWLVYEGTNYYHYADRLI